MIRDDWNYMPGIHRICGEEEDSAVPRGRTGRGAANLITERFGSQEGILSVREKRRGERERTPGLEGMGGVGAGGQPRGQLCGRGTTEDAGPYPPPEILLVNSEVSLLKLLSCSDSLYCFTHGHISTNGGMGGGI